MAISLNDQELAALAGLPHLQIILYVMAIRPRMDFDSALVGVSPRISWQALAEWCYIEPHPGIKGGPPDKSALRRAAEGLERAGLIRNLSERSKDGRQLVFRCLLANRGKFVQKKADTKPTHEADIPKPAPAQAAPVQADIPETPKADKHPASGSISMDTSSSLDISKGAGVEFASIIKPQSRTAITKYLQAIPEDDRQAMVDDLAGYMSQQSGKGVPVGNPAGVLRKMVERHRAGMYAPELHDIGAKLRKRDQAQKIQAAQAAPSPTPEKRAKKAAPVNLKEFLTKKGMSA
jgi:hypothetical protein